MTSKSLGQNKNLFGKENPHDRLNSAWIVWRWRFPTKNFRASGHTLDTELMQSTTQGIIITIIIS